MAWATLPELLFSTEEMSLPAEPALAEDMRAKRPRWRVDCAVDAHPLLREHFDFASQRNKFWIALEFLNRLLEKCFWIPKKGIGIQKNEELGL